MSGVLRSETLLCRGSEAGEFGTFSEYPGCTVGDALFLFLKGAPDENFDMAGLKNKPLVCMSAEWEEFLLANFTDIKKYTRWHMHPRSEFDFSNVRPMPEGYEVRRFGASEFAARPFGHGDNYKDAEEFEKNGAGAVIYRGGEIVSSASSFLTFENEVELDVSTSPDHRRKHLAENCVAEMLRVCAEKGLKVHWDAQNIQSKNMGEKFGFELDQEYIVYCLP